MADSLSAPPAQRAPREDTQPEAGPPTGSGPPTRGPRLGPVGWLRWGWRQITSMRTALFLLLLVAVAAIPGSMLPQRTTNAPAVSEWIEERPTAGAVLDALGMFDVFVSPWFSAIYLLLVLSLIGCIVPRIALHLKAVRGVPPATPARLDRLPAYAAFTTEADADEVLAISRAALGRARFRLRPAGDDGERAGPSVSAERGYLRETGNILFHVGLVVVIVALAWGYLSGWKADRIVAVGGSFVNDVSSYDTFLPGPWVDPGELDPWQLRVDSLDVRFQDDPTLPQFGQARDFSAQTTITYPHGGGSAQEQLTVNGPLHFGDASVFLMGNGYAPVITVRDAAGDVLYRQATPFLPQDDVYTSTGAVKVAGARPEQLGFTGVFLPTAHLAEEGPVSVYPGLGEPALVLNVYQGELFGDGPQSVYSLDVERMAQLKQPDGTPVSIWLTPGATVPLPDGLGSISMEAEIPRWAGTSTRYDPGKGLALVSALTALTGLVISLTVRRRRVFVRVTEDSSGIHTVHVGGLARGEDPLLADALYQVADRLATAVARQTGAPTNRLAVDPPRTRQAR